MCFIFSTLTEEQAARVEEVMAGGRHLLALINDVVDLAAIEAAYQRFTEDSAETPRALLHMLAFFRAVTRTSGNRVLMLTLEPLLRLMEPTLAQMLESVPQARARIMTAQRRIADAVDRFLGRSQTFAIGNLALQEGGIEELLQGAAEFRQRGFQRLRGYSGNGVFDLRFSCGR